MQTPEWARDRRLWLALGVTFLLLVGGYLLKARCLDTPWDGSQYDERCYNDLQVIYAIRGLADDQMPYVDAFNEYPVVSGLWMYGAALLSDAPEAFMRWNAVALGLLALATTALLFAMVEDKRRVYLFAAAPPLFLYAFHNWDLIAVFAAVAGLYAFRRERWMVAGAWFAIGASAKIWPGFFLPFLGLQLLRDERRLDGNAGRFGIGAVVALGVLHLPFLLIDRARYLEGYLWHLERGPTWESFWQTARHWSAEWSLGFVQTLVSPEVLPLVTKGVFGVGLVALLAAVWWRRLSGLEASFGAVLLMLVVNQVFSLQYVLWLLPFFVLLDRVPVAAALLLFLADALVFASIWPFFAGIGTPAQADLFERLSFAVAFRFAVFVGMLAMVVAWAADVDWRAAARRLGIRGRGGTETVREGTGRR